MVYIAFYKAKGTLFDRLIRLITRSPYSHCEIVIPLGSLYAAVSSSPRDGGVRLKYMVLKPGHWDIQEVPWVDPTAVLSWYRKHRCSPYSYLNAVGAVLPFLRRRKGFSCTQACMSMMGLGEEPLVSPGLLAAMVQLTRKTSHGTDPV